MTARQSQETKDALAKQRQERDMADFAKSLEVLSRDYQHIEIVFMKKEDFEDFKNNRYSLVEKIVFAACGIVLTAFVTGLAYLAFRGGK